MVRRWVASAWVGLAIAVVALAGCSGTHRPGPTIAGTHTAKPGGSATSGSMGAATGRPLIGKYSSLAVAFPGASTGVLLMGGFADGSQSLRTWAERSTDGGRHWTAGTVQTGAHTATAQAGLAFVTDRSGWAYLPDLYYTTDAGLTWQRGPNKPALVSHVAVAGSSTWVVGVDCVSGPCPDRIYQTEGVGASLTLLAHQPAGDEQIEAIARPSAAIAVLIASPYGANTQRRLFTTEDAGNSWRARPAPCPSGMQPAQLSAPDAASLWLTCNPLRQGMCGSCGPDVVYRSLDAGQTWQRMTPTRQSPPHSFAGAGPFDAVSASVAWGLESNPGNVLVTRTMDGGRSWHPVLTGDDNDLLAGWALTSAGPDSAWTVTSTTTASGGIRFVVYRTTDHGTTWQRAVIPTPH
jgi:hypothetical protein